MLRIHASYHKCLTMLFYRTMNTALNRLDISKKKKYRHFESVEGMFYNLNQNYYLSSINGFAPQLDKLGEDFRISRFIRDPRDLIISGYFYHKRGAEPWFRFVDPTNKYWAAINAVVPENMPKGITYAEYLNSISFEEGLKAEMEFRKYHFESMLEWPEDKRVKLFRYEDIMYNQVNAFKEIVEHYEIDGFLKRKIIYCSKKYAFENRKNDKHIRNSNSGQWKSHFSEDLNDLFIEQYGDILELYGYSKY